MSKIKYFYSYASITALSVGLQVPYVIAEQQDGETTNRLGSLVIVGEKTERSLKETTSSVSVITQEDLSNTQYYSVNEAVSDLTNVVALSGAVPDIRGVKGNGAAGGFNSISGGAKARVTTLIDGVAEPFVADLTGDSGLWDVEQIEVYRGPQSTSNGRNSIGGSIYVKTADPTFDWEGAARVAYRNKDSFVDKAIVMSGPILEDTLAFRLSAQRIDAHTIGTNEPFDTNPAPYDLNGIETNRIRGKLLWQVNDDVELLFSHSSNSEEGASGRNYYVGPNPWTFERTWLRDIDTDSDTTSIRLDAQLSDDVSLDILMATMDYKWGFDSYAATISAQQQLKFDETNHIFDAKLNFGETSQTLHGFIGLAWFERDQDILSEGSVAYTGNDNSDSKALYGEVTYALSDQLDVIAGGRFERESQTRNFNIRTIDTTLDDTNSIFLPKLAFQYDVNDDHTLGFSARRGYNSAGGALNFSAGEYYLYDEETVNSYEFSLRSSLADGNLDLLANVFYNDYDGFQAQNSSRRIVNMDNAITYGAELEVAFRPRSDLELKAGFGLLKTEIKDAGDSYAAVNGNELNSAPNFTANVSVNYDVNNELSLGADVNYVGEYFGDIENVEEHIAGDYLVTRFTADYHYKNWHLAAFINNAFNEKAFTIENYADRSYPDGYFAIVEPRNAGFSVTYNF